MPSVAATLAPLEALPREVYDLPRPVRPELVSGATIARQFSLWPFGTRVLKLFLLCDPTSFDPAVNQALLRAMQHEYFRSEARSQTNALRSAILAAHFTLRERNQAKLAHERVTSAAACAVTRGTTAYVALAGEAAALSWANGMLCMHRGPVRVARPLGGETVPRVVFWSAPLGPGDRLALVCGAAWKDDSAEAVADVLGAPHEAIREHLALLLAGSDGPARVWLAEGPASTSAHGRHRPEPSAGPLLADPAASDDEHLSGTERPARGSRPRRTRRGLIVAVLLLAAISLGALGVRRALDLRAQAAQAQAPATASSAVRPWRVANLGQAAGNLADLVVGDDAAYALDVQGQAVRRFGLTERTGDDGSIAVRRGIPIGRGSLEAPTAIAWVADSLGHGELAVLDRARNAVLVAPSGEMRRLELPRSTEWKSIDAVEGDRDALLVLDRTAARILAYDQLDSGDGPRVREVANSQSAPGLRLQDVDDLVASNDLYLHYADGSVRRIDQQGRQLPFDVTAPKGPLGPVAGIARDGGSGLYLLDAVNRCILQVTADGHLVRMIPLADADALATSRLVQATGDGQRLVFADAQGVEAIDLPVAAVPHLGGAPS